MAFSSIRPTILAISLDHVEMVESIHQHLWDAIRSRADLVFASNMNDAFNFLVRSPHAVLLADSAVAKCREENSFISTQLLEYVRNGGTVVMCCAFTSFISPDNFTKWISKKWGLEWTFSDYVRTIFFLNPAADNLCRSPGLAANYSMKAICLKGVEEKAKIYHPTKASFIQSSVFLPEQVSDTSQAAVAFQKVGNGWLGYIGDANSEDSTIPVVLAMCGLMSIDACFYCEKKGKDVTLMACACCKKARYCSQACQKKDWKNHKVVCVAPA